jgi:hypothetical protein
MSYSINGIVSTSPPGSVIAYFASSDPAGWIICNGVTRTNGGDGRYNTLISLGIGTGTNNSNYTPPNLRAMFLRGTGTNGNYAGPNILAQQTDGIISHSHNFTYNDTSRGSSASDTVTSIQTSGGEKGVTTQNQANGLTETRPVNIGVNWIIKL